MFQDEGNVIQQIPLEQQLFSWLTEGPEKMVRRLLLLTRKVCLQFSSSLFFSFFLFLIHCINNLKMHIGSVDGEASNR